MRKSRQPQPTIQGLFSAFLMANINTVAQLTKELESAVVPANEAAANISSATSARLEHHILGLIKPRDDEEKQALRDWIGVQVAQTAQSRPLLITLACWAVGIEETRELVRAETFALA